MHLFFLFFVQANCFWPDILNEIVLTAGDYISANQIYEDIQDIGALKKHMVNMLEDYNSMAGIVHMDLVLFRDAIEHGKLSSTFTAKHPAYSWNDLFSFIKKKAIFEIYWTHI